MPGIFVSIALLHRGPLKSSRKSTCLCTDRLRVEPAMETLASFVPRALLLDRNIVREHAGQRFGHVRMVDNYLQAYEAILNPNWDGQPSLARAREL